MTATPPVHKRLIICCDGTWNDADSEDASPSNVTRISRLFSLACDDGSVQIVNYQSGVGTGSNTADTLLGGAFGIGVAERVRDAYYFLAQNYMPGDDIILIGFSRGAFTARSVAGLIGQIGLLTREGMEDFYPIFEDMESWNKPSYKDPFPTRPFPDKPTGPLAAPLYRQKLADLGMTRPDVPVKAIAVWDTVGSLGIPQTALMHKLHLQPSAKWYQFFDTSLAPSMLHAFQALALDEVRPPFAPAVWELGDNNKTDLRQCWFPGDHSNVGGGKPDQGMADITLAWMMDQLASVGVEFDPEAVGHYIGQIEEWYRKHPSEKRWASREIYEQFKPMRPWALGAITGSKNFVYKFAGQLTRTPGTYHQVDPVSLQPKETYLNTTNESIHPSVRVRIAAEGLGLNDKGTYDAPALRHWSYRDGGWDYTGNENIKVRRLPEAEIGPFGQQLLQARKSEQLFGLQLKQ